MIDVTSLPPFLAELLGEIEKADTTAFHPPGDVKPGETVLGIAHPWTQKAFSLYLFYSKELEHAQLDFKFCQDSENEKYSARITQLESKKDFLDALVWGSCREQFGLWKRASVGMRKDWKFVKFESGSERVGDFLRKILGGQ